MEGNGELCGRTRTSLLSRDASCGRRFVCDRRMPFGILLRILPHRITASGVRSSSRSSAGSPDHLLDDHLQTTLPTRRQFLLPPSRLSPEFLQSDVLSVTHRRVECKPTQDVPTRPLHRVFCLEIGEAPLCSKERGVRETDGEVTSGVRASRETAGAEIASRNFGCRRRTRVC